MVGMIRSKLLPLVVLLPFLVCGSTPALAKAPSPTGGSRWGADYFPNVPLITHEGKEVRFFDDLIEDKVVAINFIFTSCQDSCPLETARMSNLQSILGDRVGSDVFLYSISIDPETDTPEVLAAYRKKFKARPGWVFLTGKEEDITLLRRKLGLYQEDIQSDDSTDHNLSLIIGNQSTGRWMKRSPFENPYVLAAEIGGELHNWKQPRASKNDYANAPQLRDISKGESLFRTRCAACHTIGSGAATAAVGGVMGPDLMGVTERRERVWLERWLFEPDKMLEEGDPIALQLYEEYGQLSMPNSQLNQVEVDSLIRFLADENRRLMKQNHHHASGAAEHHHHHASDG